VASSIKPWSATAVVGILPLQVPKCPPKLAITDLATTGDQ